MNKSNVRKTIKINFSNVKEVIIYSLCALFSLNTMYSQIQPEIKLDTICDSTFIVEIPKYKRIEEVIVVAPAKAEWVKTEKGGSKLIEIPEQTRTLSRPILVNTKKEEIYTKLVCESDINKNLLLELELVLGGKGYIYKLSGFDMPKLLEYIKPLIAKYQKENNLVQYFITFETLDHLGLNYIH